MLSSSQLRAATVATLGAAALALTSPAAAAPPGPRATLTPSAAVKFAPLDPQNPGGPQTAIVFGDFTKKAPVGFFLKVPAGFKPGPHTHSSDYHAVVVAGKVHNFAPGSDEGAGADAGGTWFQPGKAVHDNHCEPGAECVIFIYMPKGFDFLPAAQ